MLISENTQAILLLTAPLIYGDVVSSVKLLSIKEYKVLAAHLRSLGWQPADFLSTTANSVIGKCSSIIDEDRLKKLLSRGFLLSQVLEQWQSRSIWVISRADRFYPSRLKSVLKEDAPPILYGCGDISLLEVGGLAVVGPRETDSSSIEFASSVGKMCARTGKMLISGGARGIDRAGMEGASDHGGYVCEVVAEHLMKVSLRKEYLQPLRTGQLVLVSPFDPSSKFTVANAMQRNKFIYALSDIALVVDSDFKRGGTWAGAIEQLEKFRFVPIYVRFTENRKIGLDALVEKGALYWPDFIDIDSFLNIFDRTSHAENSTKKNLTATSSAALDNSEQERQSSHKEIPDKNLKDFGPSVHGDVLNFSQEFFLVLEEILKTLLVTPMDLYQVSKCLDVIPEQADLWLRKLVTQKKIYKSPENIFSIDES